MLRVKTLKKESPSEYDGYLSENNKLARGDYYPVHCKHKHTRQSAKKFFNSIMQTSAWNFYYANKCMKFLRTNITNKLTRISWPIQEYDDFLVAAQKIANATHNIKTTRERIEISPRNGKFNFFLPQPLHLLLAVLFETR